MSDRKPLLSLGKFHQYQQKVFKSNPKAEPVATQSFPQLIKQEEENDPVRKEIANQMKPNTRGYYAVLVPRNITGITSTEVQVQHSWKFIGQENWAIVSNGRIYLVWKSRKQNYTLRLLH